MALWNKNYTLYQKLILIQHPRISADKKKKNSFCVDLGWDTTDTITGMIFFFFFFCRNSNKLRHD